MTHTSVKCHYCHYSLHNLTNKATTFSRLLFTSFIPISSKMPKIKQNPTVQESQTKPAKPQKRKKPTKDDFDGEKSPKVPKTDGEETKTKKPFEDGKVKQFKGKKESKGNKFNPSMPEEKVEDWNKFKKEKKELKMKRIKARTKDNFDRIQQAKKMGEKVRLKTLKEGERNKVINQLHELLKGHYAKLVLPHDTARIVQWLLKYSSKILLHQISQELVPVTISMLQSKYGIHCIKRLLKYGEDDIRTAVIDQMKGHAVKLATHTISAPVLEFAFSNYATSTQKQLLVQEFYGDLYKNTKDAEVKHLRDVYKENGNMKAATLSACKANIKKVLNKSLLDSGLVQTVVEQYLEECPEEDRAELITELAAHVVVISNSRDGSKAAMQCIWYGTTKDKKVIMKTLKEHLVELSKHEFGHRTVIALLDTVDDTVLLHKIILTEILQHAKDLAVSEWGRKVLLWLVAPADQTIFHPHFITELTQGRDKSNSKKSAETRRQEILSHSINTLLNLIIEDTQFWMSSGSLAIEMSAIIKAGSGKTLDEALQKIAETTVDPTWTVNEVAGIENAGLHMVLKKLTKHGFGPILVEAIDDQVVEAWVKVNRACFLLVAVMENSSAEVQKLLKKKLKSHAQLLKAQKTQGAKILLKKL